MEEVDLEKIEEVTNKISYIDTSGVRRFKSVHRAYRRGHCSISGTIYPRRPFNNRKDRPIENEKRKIYEHIKQYGYFPRY